MNQPSNLPPITWKNLGVLVAASMSLGGMYYSVAGNKEDVVETREVVAANRDFAETLENRIRLVESATDANTQSIKYLTDMMREWMPMLRDSTDAQKMLSESIERLNNRLDQQ